MGKQNVAGIDYSDPRVLPAAIAMIDAKDPVFTDRVRHVLAAADEADQAAGIQRVKQRVITNCHELTELPALSIVLYDDSMNGGDIRTYIVPDDGTVMYYAGQPDGFHFVDFSEESVLAQDMPLPITVLREGPAA